jgi:hypothetical protein
MKHEWKTVIGSGVETALWCVYCGTVKKITVGLVAAGGPGPFTYYIVGTKKTLSSEPKCYRIPQPEIPKEKK